MTSTPRASFRLGATRLTLIGDPAMNDIFPPMSIHRKRLMLRLARKLTQQQIDCVAYVLVGRHITDHGDRRWCKLDVITWHEDNLSPPPSSSYPIEFENTELGDEG